MPGFQPLFFESPLLGSFGLTLKQFACGEYDRPLDFGDEIMSISGVETVLKDADTRVIGVFGNQLLDLLDVG